MSIAIPLPDEEEFLRFWDCLSHDLGVFAAAHPERVPGDEDEIEEQRAAAELMELADDLYNGRPRPPRAPLPEPPFTVNYLPHDYRELHERAEHEPAILALFIAYRAGLTEDEARRHAALDLAAYHDALAQLAHWYREILRD